MTAFDWHLLSLMPVEATLLFNDGKKQICIFSLQKLMFTWHNSQERQRAGEKEKMTDERMARLIVI
jgi:hypothetical protein